MVGLVSDLNKYLIWGLVFTSPPPPPPPQKKTVRGENTCGPGGMASWLQFTSPEATGKDTYVSLAPAKI